MAGFVITRIHVGDYDRWRPLFDQDRPRAREQATVQRVFRDADDPNHVFIFLEFPSLEDRLVGRVEPRFDRKSKKLEVLGAWGDTSRLDEALASLASFFGAR